MFFHKPEWGQDDIFLFLQFANQMENVERKIIDRQNDFVCRKTLVWKEKYFFCFYFYRQWICTLQIFVMTNIWLKKNIYFKTIILH